MIGKNSDPFCGKGLWNQHSIFYISIKWNWFLKEGTIYKMGSQKWGGSPWLRGGRPFYFTHDPTHFIEETGRGKELLISSEPRREKKLVLSIILVDPYFMVYWPFQSWLTWELFGPYGIGCMTKKPLPQENHHVEVLPTPQVIVASVRLFITLIPILPKKHTSVV